MFPSVLRQRLASVAMRIVSVNDLFKELSLVCNLNISSLRAHVQEIVIIVQEIVISVLLEPTAYEMSNQFIRPLIQSRIPVYEALNPYRPLA